jgi:N-acetyl-D-muramate 6-phosphate phosphatase
MMSAKPQAVLFDLDGTLLDTAPDLLSALNQLRSEFKLAPMSLADIRPTISQGSKKMVKHVLGIDETHADFLSLREYFLQIYDKQLADRTQLFPEIETILSHLEQNQIKWGIVTNKLTRQTLPLLKALNLSERTGCLICGDTLPTYKPHPEPILQACQLLQADPSRSLYVGDAITDIVAAKAAGTKAIAALYGYIGDHEDPYTWEADGYLKQPIDLMAWL